MLGGVLILRRYHQFVSCSDYKPVDHQISGGGKKISSTETELGPNSPSFFSQGFESNPFSAPSLSYLTDTKEASSVGVMGSQKNNEA